MGKVENNLLHLPIQKVDRKDPSWSSRLSDKLMRMPPDSMPARIQRWRWMRLLRLTERRARVMKTGKRLWTNDRTNSKKTTRMHQWQQWVSLDRRSRKIRKLAEFVHTSLSETMTHELNQPLRNMVLRNPLQVDHRQILNEAEGERIFRRSNWNSTLNRNQWKLKYSTI